MQAQRGASLSIGSRSSHASVRVARAKVAPWSGRRRVFRGLDDRHAPPCIITARASSSSSQLRRGEFDDDESMTLAELKAKLEMAVEEEDYDLAAQIRDTLQRKQSDSRLAVEDANRRFYDAFASGRADEMARCWGQGEHVQCVHPGGGVVAGREAVMESWKAVLSGVRPRAFRIRVEDVRVAAGDTQGFVTCTEHVETDDARGRTIATNVFEKQRGKWVIVMHHGSPLMRGGFGSGE